MPVHLSPRRREILQHIADGYSNPEIAHLLGLSEHTVRMEIYRMFQLTGAENRLRLVKRFYLFVPVQNN